MDCYCGASRDVSDPSSACECDSGYKELGDAHCSWAECLADEPNATGCERCAGANCVMCKYGYHLIDDQCLPCQESDCDDLNSDLPPCRERGWRIHTGICSCSGNELEGRVDNFMCRTCGQGCSDCDDSIDPPVCRACKKEYSYYPDLAVCIMMGTIAPMGLGFWYEDGVLLGQESLLFSFDFSTFDDDNFDV